MFDSLNSWEDIAFIFLVAICFIVFLWGYFSLSSALIRNIKAKKHTKSSIVGLLVFSLSPLLSVVGVSNWIYQDSYGPTLAPSDLMAEYSSLHYTTKALFNG